LKQNYEPISLQNNSNAQPWGGACLYRREKCIFNHINQCSDLLRICKLLLEAVMFGVIAIPYEYEGTTLDALMEKLRLGLQGRQAK